jgi:type II secretory pathway pseudopilin PulG
LLISNQTLNISSNRPLEIMIVVAIIRLLAAIAVPSFLRARMRAQASTVLNEARQLDGAKDQYALENG